MQQYFSVSLEFNHDLIYETIENSLRCNNKGYVCVIDANVLTNGQKNPKYKKIINFQFIKTF